MERKSVVVCFFLVCLVGAQVGTEAAICSVPSGRFSGMCFSSSTCSNTCQRLEGLKSGHCTGFACYCSRNC